jgi:hypothetical protein
VGNWPEMQPTGQRLDVLPVWVLTRVLSPHCPGSLPWRCQSWPSHCQCVGMYCRFRGDNLAVKGDHNPGPRQLRTELSHLRSFYEYLTSSQGIAVDRGAHCASDQQVGQRFSDTVFSPTARSSYWFLFTLVMLLQSWFFRHVWHIFLLLRFLRYVRVSTYILLITREKHPNSLQRPHPDPHSPRRNALFLNSCRPAMPSFFKKMFSQQLAFVFNSVRPAACLLFQFLSQPSIICNSDMYVAQDT